VRSLLIVRPGEGPDIASGGEIGDDPEIPSAPSVIRIIGSHMSWSCPAVRDTDNRVTPVLAVPGPARTGRGPPEVAARGPPDRS
jgi:hypothetical protein